VSSGRTQPCRSLENQLIYDGGSGSAPETRRATDIVDVWGGGSREQENCPIQLRASAIAGIGAFAKWDLDRHTVIGEYTGEPISSSSELEARRKEYDRGEIGDYIFETEENCAWLDATFSACAV
jgi:hypothetical protein